MPVPQQRWSGTRSSSCKCLPSFRLARQRWTGTVSGCCHPAAVTDVDGAEVKSAPQSSLCLCCQRAGLPIPHDWPQLAYIFPAPLDALCFNWMGRSADRGRCVGAAGAEGLERKSRPSRQIALSASPGSLHSPAGHTNRSSPLRVVCRPLSCPPK